MYLYQVGYGTCEESDFRQYMHRRKFSKEELEEVVAQCMAEVLRETGVENGYDGKGRWVQSVMPDDSEGHFNRAMQAQGFEGVQYDAHVCLFGWGAVDDPEDWSTYRREDDKRILGRVMELYEKG